jgi:hypothetical protein
VLFYYFFLYTPVNGQEIKKDSTALQNMPLPVPNSTTSFWRARPHKLDGHRSKPDLPPTTDILIIGAGFSRVACAYYLTKDAPSPAPSITLLGARELYSGATGRNGGHMKPDRYDNMPKYTELFGAEAIASIASYEASQVYAVKEPVEQEGINCAVIPYW